MADWLGKFSKKKENTEALEDFVLFEGTEPNTKESLPAESRQEENFDELTESLGKSSETADSLSETMQLDFPDFSDLEDADSSESAKKSGAFFAFCKKYKSILLGIGISIGAILVVWGTAAVLSMITNPLYGYTQVTVAKGNVIPSIEASGTMTPNAHYSITSLVSGTVLESTPEIGDYVEAGSVLYQLDDTEAQLAVKRAENQVEKSKAIGASGVTPTLKIYAGEAGIIQSLNIRTGSTVSAGQIIATIQRADGTVTSVSSAVSGTVYVVHVSQGRSVSSGSLIATILDTQSEINQKSSIYDQKSNEYDLEAAKKQLEYYTIKSPVSGIVTEKNTKVGDNVSITNTENPMMVIVDMNSLKFTFQVDEYTVREMETGQIAILDTESLPDETFTGKVTRVSSEGSVNQDGKTMFDVDVTVDEPGDLKAGMKIHARIVLASATNVLYLPKEALLEADEESAFVLVKETVQNDTSQTPKNTKTPKATQAMDPEDPDNASLNLPSIQVPKGCRLVAVQYGISDGTNVQILSGLKQGDIVVYHPDWETKSLVPDTVTPTSAPVATEPFHTAESDGIEADWDVFQDTTDEELKRQIQERIKENSQASSQPTTTQGTKTQPSSRPAISTTL